jgi:hypothetical protein
MMGTVRGGAGKTALKWEKKLHTASVKRIHVAIGVLLAAHRRTYLYIYIPFFMSTGRSMKIEISKIRNKNVLDFLTTKFRRFQSITFIGKESNYSL